MSCTSTQPLLVVQAIRSTSSKRTSPTAWKTVFRLPLDAMVPHSVSSVKTQPGLYTVTRAYGGSAFNLGNVDAGANEGVTISYAAETWSIGVSIENGIGADLSQDDANFEVALAFTGVENLNVGVGFFSDNRAVAANEVDVTNVHATYQVGKALLGAEYTQLDGTVDLEATMFLIDYDVSDKLGVAVRYSTYENAAPGVDVDTFTVAPNYALTDSLGAILEYSDTNAAAGDSDTIALELTYTF